VEGSGLIRELHVYGPALHIGAAGDRQAQHRGLGSELLISAEAIAAEAGWPRLTVIAALGTQDYYRRRGYREGELYMHKSVAARSVAQQAS